jgi:hypothetical protein
MFPNGAEVRRTEAGLWDFHPNMYFLYTDSKEIDHKDIWSSGRGSMRCVFPNGAEVRRMEAGLWVFLPNMYSACTDSKQIGHKDMGYVFPNGVEVTRMEAGLWFLFVDEYFRLQGRKSPRGETSLRCIEVQSDEDLLHRAGMEIPSHMRRSYRKGLRAFGKVTANTNKQRKIKKTTITFVIFVRKFR